jgi:hypothetical protein
MKRATLVKGSANVVMQSKASTIGKPAITSTIILSHGRVALGRGRSEPSGLVVKALMRWHGAHVLQKCVTVFRIHGHQNIFETLSRVLLGSRCPAFLWYSVRTRSRRVVSLGKQISSAIE